MNVSSILNLSPNPNGGLQINSKGSHRFEIRRKNEPTKRVDSRPCIKPRFKIKNVEYLRPMEKSQASDKTEIKVLLNEENCLIEKTEQKKREYKEEIKRIDKIWKKMGYLDRLKFGLLRKGHYFSSMGDWRINLLEYRGEEPSI